MLYPQILLGLVATVSAIDSYFHLGENCDGPAIVCTGLNPDVCCTASASNSVGYRGIPLDWSISTTAFTGGGCTNYGNRGSASGSNFICMPRCCGNAGYSGTKYRFGSKKRSEIEGEALTGTEEEEEEDKPCTSSQKANQLVLVDGTKYDIVDLDDDNLNQLVCCATLNYPLRQVYF